MPEEIISHAGTRDLPPADRQKIQVTLTVDGRSGWSRQNIFVKSGDTIRFSSWSGSVTIGHGAGYAVDATGKLETGEIRGPSNDEYPVKGINQYCVAVGLARSHRY